jgi:hypothetical protein
VGVGHRHPDNDVVADRPNFEELVLESGDRAEERQLGGRVHRVDRPVNVHCEFARIHDQSLSKLQLVI